MALLTTDETRILDQVRDWSAERRLKLAQALLRTLADELNSRPTRPRSLRDLLGLLQTSEPAPSDEQCRQFLDEALLDKYGK